MRSGRLVYAIRASGFVASCKESLSRLVYIWVAGKSSLRLMMQVMRVEHGLPFNLGLSFGRYQRHSSPATRCWLLHVRPARHVYPPLTTTSHSRSTPNELTAKRSMCPLLSPKAAPVVVVSRWASHVPVHAVWQHSCPGEVNNKRHHVAWRQHMPADGTISVKHIALNAKTAS